VRHKANVRPERGLSTILHCLQWYNLVRRTRLSTAAVQYPILATLLHASTVSEMTYNVILVFRAPHLLPVPTLNLTHSLTQSLDVCWGFANAGDRNRLEYFLRRAGKSGYHKPTCDSLPTVTVLCEQADEQLFHSIKHTPTHTLRRLLPPECSTPYHTRARLHNYELLLEL